MTIDVRAILDGQMWPRDVHDFVGDVVDILDEQLEPLDNDDRGDVAHQLLDLLGDDDLILRTWAVLSLRRATEILGINEVQATITDHQQQLDVPPRHAESATSNASRRGPVSGELAVTNRSTSSKTNFDSRDDDLSIPERHGLENASTG